MSAQIVQLVDDVVDELNATAFSQSFTAQRTYLPTHDLAAGSSLAVLVVPRGDDMSLDSRNQSRHEYSVDIAVLKKLRDVTNDEIDPLMQLVEEIADHFTFHVFPANTSLIASAATVLYSMDHLREQRQFTAIITLTFRGYR